MASLQIAAGELDNAVGVGGIGTTLIVIFPLGLLHPAFTQDT